MRLKALVAVLGVGAVVACAPVQSGPTNSGTDEQTGQLRVWLFDEVNRGPKEAVVKEAISEFQGKHSGVTVDVQYIQVSSRAERFKAAFSDPKSAPDVAEFGNTDLAGYVSAGGFSELDLGKWDESKDLVPSILDTAKVDGKTYGVPWFVGVRALYYRTDVFTELGLKPPTTLDEIATTAREIRQKKPELIGISAGGKYLFAALPFIWAQGGDIAKSDGGKFTATIDSAEAKAGVAKYTELIKDDICPPATCAGNGGDASVEAFRAGKAAMTIGGDFNRKSVDASSAAGKYGVVPLPGKTKGSVAPAFMRRQPARRHEGHAAQDARERVHAAARVEEVPAEDVHGDGQPADVRRRAEAGRGLRQVPGAVHEDPAVRHEVRPRHAEGGRRSRRRPWCRRCSRRSSPARRTSTRPPRTPPRR